MFEKAAAFYPTNLMLQQALNFTCYEKSIKQGSKNRYTFLSLYYQLNMVFTEYVESLVQCLHILKLLSGNVYDESVVLQEMKTFVEQVEHNLNDILRSLIRDVNGVEFKEQAG
ncbi:MAG: hypothetical protein AAF629_03250 [Chloroflexota bacterium]